MHAPLSMILFTTLVGAAQGLLLVLVGLELAAARAPTLLYVAGAGLVLLLSGVALVAAMFHLGHPLRAWRAVMMWRTSWMSREVIVLPAFMAVVFAWGLSAWFGAPTLIWGLLAAVLALVLFVCTGMIYAAVKVMREWAHPIVPVNFGLMGMASGLLLASAMAAAVNVPATPLLAKLALLATLLAAAGRGWAFRRNLRLAPKTTVQSALGVRHPRVVQISQGTMAGTFNTREFFHGASPSRVTQLRWAAVLLGFVLPAAALAAGLLHPGALALLWVLQWLGLMAERWSFFTEARHPQNLYQQKFG